MQILSPWQQTRFSERAELVPACAVVIWLFIYSMCMVVTDVNHVNKQ